MDIPGTSQDLEFKKRERAWEMDEQVRHALLLPSSNSGSMDLGCGSMDLGDIGGVVAIFKPGREGPDTCRDNHPEPWHSGPTENQLWNSIPLDILLREEN